MHNTGNFTILSKGNIISYFAIEQEKTIVLQQLIIIEKFYLCERKRPIGFALYLKTLEYPFTKIIKLENEKKMTEGK